MRALISNFYGSEVWARWCCRQWSWWCSWWCLWWWCWQDVKLYLHFISWWLCLGFCNWLKILPPKELVLKKNRPLLPRQRVCGDVDRLDLGWCGGNNICSWKGNVPSAVPVESVDVLVSSSSSLSLLPPLFLPFSFREATPFCNC